MKIAVSYANGEVFQHFGKTEFFKIYETEGKRILSGQVVPTDGIGHEALAEFLKGLGVEVVICGGLGDGAMAALTGAVETNSHTEKSHKHQTFPACKKTPLPQNRQPTLQNPCG